MAPWLPHGESQHTVRAPEGSGRGAEFPANRRRSRPERLHRTSALTDDESMHRPGEGNAAVPGEGGPDEQMSPGRGQRQAEACPGTSQKFIDPMGRTGDEVIDMNDPAPGSADC